MSLRARTITAVGWTTGAKVAQLLFQFALSAVLMRLLGPKAFGLIGMIMVFSGFAAVFSELGFSAALVQRQDLREDHRSTVFWFNMGMAGVLALLMYLAAPLVAQFYSEPLLKPMTAWLSLCFLLSAPGIVPRTLLQKALRFEVLAKVQIASLVLSGGTAIAVAAARGGVWSLVVRRRATLRKLPATSRSCFNNPAINCRRSSSTGDGTLSCTSTSRPKRGN